jgi:hypothetical protein
MFAPPQTYLRLSERLDLARLQQQVVLVGKKTGLQALSKALPSVVASLSLLLPIS